MTELTGPHVHQFSCQLRSLDFSFQLRYPLLWHLTPGFHKQLVDAQQLKKKKKKKKKTTTTKEEEEEEEEEKEKKKKNKKTKEEVRRTSWILSISVRPCMLLGSTGLREICEELLAVQHKTRRATQRL